MAQKYPSPEMLDYLRLEPVAAISCTSGAVSITSSFDLETLYVMTADHRCHFRQGPATSGAAASVVASTTDTFMESGASRYVWAWDATAGTGNNAIAFKSKVGSSGGTVFLSKVVA